MTKKETLEMIVEVMGGKELTAEEKETIVSYATNEISLIEKKAEKAKTQKENEAIKAHLLDYLISINYGVTITEIIKGNDIFSDFSTQKISALLNQLIESGEVIKIVYKKTSYFAAGKWFSQKENDSFCYLI